MENKPSSILNVGFIGLGDQGGPMARSIGEADSLTLHVWARRPTSTEIVADVPHITHTTVTDLGSVCDIVALCLNDDTDFWDVLNNQGLLKSLKPGTIVVNHATGDPKENARMSTYLCEAGHPFLDAPVSGGRPGAEARTLTTIVGGEQVVLERCRAVFETFSRKIVYMGPAGSGQMGKLLNNALTLTNLKNAVDVLTMADKLGINAASLLDMVSVSSGSSAILQALITFTPQMATHLQGLMRKDIEHFADAVHNNGFDATDLHDRGLSGANGIVDVVKLLIEKSKRD